MALWTDLAQYVGPSPNVSGSMTEVRGLVVHIAAGYYQGTISWQRNGDARVSSHFIVGREPGELAQMVDTAVTAWTQGTGNGRWISSENAGFLLGSDLWQPGWHELTAWQIEANAQLLARLHRDHGVPLQLAGSPTGRGLGYHSMGAENGQNWGHDQCPGEPIKAQLPAILARAIQIAKGDNDMFEEVDRKTATADTWRMLTVLENRDAAEYQLPGEPTKRREVNGLKVELEAMKGQLSQISAKLDNAGGAISDEQLERVLRRVLGMTPES